ncbi:MAG: PrsW family glutamic-type intramembrane protease [Bacteroidales bacterium]
MTVSDFIPLFIAPAIFLMLILMALKVMDKSTHKLFMGSYFMGLLAAIPMALVLYIIHHYWLEHFSSIRRILFFSFALVGFMAEFFKFIILRYFVIPKDSVTKPFDGILFSVMISMGYATLANVFFFFEWTYSDDLYVVLYTIPFANLLIGIILGFFIGMGKFRTNHIDSFTGLGVAVFFQGFYNFCLISHDYLLLGMVATGTLIISIMLAVKSLNTDLKSMI